MSDGVTKEEYKNRKGRRLIARTLFLLAVCGIVAFVVLAARLYKIQITENSYYESLALQYQLSQTTLTASRGTIFDANGKILAMSAVVENVFLSPFEIDRDGQDIDLIAYGLSGILDVPGELIISMGAKTYSQYEIVKYGVEYETAQNVRDFIKEFGLSGIYLEPAERR